MTENRLGCEKSPYLLQHKDNPIWWQPWGQEAFSMAKDRDVPILLSVGYATCHWCHVMEGDSFEDDEVAELINQNFVAIKLDREERPDIDSIYMAAVQAMTGRGGWPMTLFLTPDKRPLWAGTFLPKPQLMELCRQVGDHWHNNRGELTRSAESIGSHLTQNFGQLPKAAESDYEATFQEFLFQKEQLFDPTHGGFGGAPKFPPAMALMTLLRLEKRQPNQNVLAMVEATLKAMARGGMYDQLGGGFHRYSVDDRWLVPHFEKMLYDNALLGWVYTEAFQRTKNHEYRRIAVETLDYVLRDLELADGGYASAEDADSEKAEGKFYVWRQDELKQALTPAEYQAIASTYGVTAEGNFHVDRQVLELEKAAGLKEVEAGNIFCVPLSAPLPDTHTGPLKQACEKLRTLRSQRVRPLRDDKVLTGWNGLMIGTMAKAGRTFGEQRFVDSADRAAQFLIHHMVGPSGDLFRRWRDQERRFAGQLEDYAYLIHGLVELYQATHDPTWLVKAMTFQSRQDELFWDEESGTYFDTPAGADSSDLLFRPRDLADNATPSGNAISALNLVRLASLATELSCREKAQRVVAAGGEFLQRHPGAFPMTVMAMAYLADVSKEIVVPMDVGADSCQAFLKRLWQEFVPHGVIVAGRPSHFADRSPLLQGKPDTSDFCAYVCENFVCHQPETDPDQALAAVLRS